MSDTCVYVVNHKDAQSLEDKPYRLLRVGSIAGEQQGSSDEVSYDSTGDNIAFKNFAYCELTGLYWIWKNTSHDITGIMHYRRYLAAPGTNRPLNPREINDALDRFAFLVPRPVSLGCSVAEHYCFCHPAYDYLALSKAMNSQPEPYRMAFAAVMDSDTIVPCNIMIARKEDLDAYCGWLFSVLRECENYVDLYTGRDDYQRRVFGFMAERLLMVWLIANDVECGFYDVLTLESAEVLCDSIGGEYPFNLLSAVHGLDERQLFEEDFYFRQYEDVAQAYPPGKGLQHYLDHGISEGRIPSSAYAMEDYANLRPEIRSKAGEMSPRFFEALRREARRKGRPVLSKHLVMGLTKDGLIDYSPVYDWLYYTSKYDDVPSDYFHTELALRHFIEVGIPEGRQGSKGFSLDAYKEKNPDLVRRFGEDNRSYYMHYLRSARHRRAIDWRYVG